MEMRNFSQQRCGQTRLTWPNYDAMCWRKACKDSSNLHTHVGRKNSHILVPQVETNITRGRQIHNNNNNDFINVSSNNLAEGIPHC